MDDQLRVIACRAVSISDYPPERRAMWDRVAAEMAEKGEQAPTVYPGSVFMYCQACGIQVAVGPRQQEVIASGLATMVVCLVCVPTLAMGMDSVAVASLGNPHKRA